MKITKNDSLFLQRMDADTVRPDPYCDGRCLQWDPTAEEADFEHSGYCFRYMNYSEPSWAPWNITWYESKHELENQNYGNVVVPATGSWPGYTTFSSRRL